MKAGVVVIMFFCLSASPAAFAAQSDGLSLKEAVDLALANNPALKESAEKVVEAQTGVPLAKAGLYPSLSATASDTRNKDASNSGSPKFGGESYNQYSSALKLNQTIYQKGSLAAIDVANNDIRIAKLESNISARDLVSNIISAYCQVVVSQRNLEIIQLQEKIANESVQVATKRERIGRGQRLDLLQAKTQLELLHGQLSAAENNLLTSKANLSNLLGERDNSFRTVKLKSMDKLPSISEIEKMISDKRTLVPELERGQAALLRIDDQRRVLSGEYFPKLAIAGSYNFNTYNDPELFRNDANSWSLGLQLTLPLFSGFSTVYADQALASKRRQLEYGLSTVENEFAARRVISRKNLEAASASIKTGQAGYELAVASSNEARRSYRLATIDFLQMLTVQQSLSQAELSLNTYRYDYVIAIVNYFVAYGEDPRKIVDLLSFD